MWCGVACESVVRVAVDSHSTVHAWHLVCMGGAMRFSQLIPVD
jgi:hypothetical protein